MKKLIQKSEITEASDMEYERSYFKKEESKRRPSKAGLIRNKFKQMKSQEAMNDYIIGI